jgi:hypothetical protein
MLAARYCVRKRAKQTARTEDPRYALNAYQVLQTRVINMPLTYNAFEMEIRHHLLQWLAKEIAALETLIAMNVVAVGVIPHE